MCDRFSPRRSAAAVVRQTHLRCQRQSPSMMDVNMWAGDQRSCVVRVGPSILQLFLMSAY